MTQHGRRNAEAALLLALACGATAQQAAAKTGLSGRTIYRRLEDADFKRRLQALRAEMVERAAGMLTAAAMESVKTLLDLQKATVPPAVRLGAARTVLELGMKVREIVDLEQRMAALEAQVAGSAAA